MAEKHLETAAWKAVCPKETFKDVPLGKALDAYQEGVEKGDVDGAGEALDTVEKLAKKLQKDGALAQHEKARDHLVEMLKEVVKARSALGSMGGSKSESSSKDEKKPTVSGEGEDDDESGELGDQLLAGLDKVKKGAGKVELEFGAVVAKPHYGLMVARKVSPNHKQKLTELVGKGQWMSGTCVFEKAKLTFVVETPKGGLAKSLKASILAMTGKQFAVRVRDASGTLVLDDETDVEDLVETTSSSESDEEAAVEELEERLALLVGRIRSASMKKDKTILEGLRTPTRAAKEVESLLKRGDVENAALVLGKAEKLLDDLVGGDAPKTTTTPTVEPPKNPRDVVKDWESLSTIKVANVKKPRSTELKALDAALVTYSLAVPGLPRAKAAALDEVVKLIDAWRKSGKKDPKREAMVKELEVQLAYERFRLIARAEKMESDEKAAKANHSVFHALPKRFSKFAKRNAVDFTEDLFKPGMAYASSDLTAPRGPDGELTDETIEKMNASDKTAYWDSNIDLGRKGGVDGGGLSKQKLKELMDSQVNSVTKTTMFPELRNLTEPPNGEEDEEVTKTLKADGVDVEVLHNPSDVNFTIRFRMFEDAVKKVKGAGYAIPKLTVNLPKFGRDIKVGKDGKIVVNNKSNRAVYIAPGFMHLSSEIVGTPDDKKGPDGKAFYNLSTTLDPSGVATIVHELGHALHFAKSPKAYHGLWGTAFQGKDEKTGKSVLETVQAEVSGYGDKPREFVAEVFLGKVYGKNFSKIVNDAYESLDGP